MHSDLDGKHMKPFLRNKNDKCFCPYNLLEASSMQIDSTNIAKPLMYWTLKDSLIATDIYGCGCNQILSAGNQTFFNYLTIDKTNIYLFSSSEQLIYVLNKKYALLESKEDASRHLQKVPISLPNIYQVIALDGSLQQYPQTMCLIPKKKDYQVEVLNITANSIVVSLPEPIPNSGCEKYKLATTIYIISVSHCLDNNRNEFKEYNVQTHKRHYEIQNLTPFTEYRLKLALSNFYVNKLSLDLQFGADVTLRTKPGKLNAPEIVTVQVLTPTLAAVYWMPPKKLNCAAVNYEVYWISVLFPNDARKITFQKPPNKLINNLEHTDDGKVFTKIQLLPGQEYLVYVRVYPGNFSDFFTDSSNKSINMYSEPNNLTLSGVSTNGMNISWIPSVNLTIHYILEYKSDAMPKWKEVYKKNNDTKKNNNTKKNNDTVTYYIEDLLPRTKYKFRLILRYPEYMENFIWPLDERFIFETHGKQMETLPIKT
ncbi:proto-oncogene tyrosine-protein kinase ros [Lasius niger]|uniref:Proto-oncogene tyrosine-protein kinase ros n=1 Tax=Lasius niger TaxID=67767 RepID=A0A0J7NCD8_LASNI|nr:proto-oncogene tyrosine-protein kinase ros [Lasius niger]